TAARAAGGARADVRQVGTPRVRAAHRRQFVAHATGPTAGRLLVVGDRRILGGQAGAVTDFRRTTRSRRDSGCTRADRASHTRATGLVRGVESPRGGTAGRVALSWVVATRIAPRIAVRPACPSTRAVSPASQCVSPRRP